MKYINCGLLILVLIILIKICSVLIIIQEENSLRVTEISYNQYDVASYGAVVFSNENIKN